MSSYYYGTITNGITLTIASQNPVYIGHYLLSAYVTNATTAHYSDAIYGNSAAAWTISNYGTIRGGGGTLSSGIDLRAGGHIFNMGPISGERWGVRIAGGAGAIFNFDTISGGLSGSDGVSLGAGGSVINSIGGLISGGHYGVRLTGGAGTVGNDGTIEGRSATNASGIYLLGSAGMVTNSGTIRGAGPKGNGVFLAVTTSGTGIISNAASGIISGVSNGAVLAGPAGTISNSGTIQGTGTANSGVFLVVAPANGLVGNASGALIEGDFAGISFYYSGIVTNSGIIRANGSAGNGVILNAGGTVTNSGTIEGLGANAFGVNLLSSFVGAEISNASGGLISGGYDGVRLPGGTVTNSGTIEGAGTNGSGIYLSGFGGSISNSGTIRATGTAGAGIFLDATVAGAAVVGNASGGVIFGGFDGVLLAGASATVSNSGTVLGGSGTYGAGVALDGTAGVVSNFATIMGLGTNGAGIFFFPNAVGGTINNASGGLISGEAQGIFMHGAAGTVSNLGTILATGTSGNIDGIYMNAGTVVNGATDTTAALISGANSGVYIAGTFGTVSNFATIQGSGTDSAGIFVVGSAIGGQVSNAPGASIAGDAFGVAIYGSGTVTNAGTIAAGGDYGSGVVLNVGGTVVNSGTIQGLGTSGAGVFLLDTASGAQVSNALSGLMAGGFVGVGISGPGTVNNLGTIAGPWGVYMKAGAIVNGTIGTAGGLISGEAYGIKIRGNGDVSNYGTILATATGGYGIYLSVGTVTNTGTIVAGTDGTGVYVYSGAVTNTSGGTIVAPGSLGQAVVVQHGTFYNYGAVTGSVVGIAVSAGTGGIAGVVNVAGTVEGATGIDVTPNATVSQTVTVFGTVSGTSGTAVSLGGGTNRLVLAPGAAFQGAVDGGGGASILEIAAGAGAGAATGLAGAAAALSTVYVMVGQVTNFSALQIDPSAALDPSGVLSFDTLINQGQINIGSGDVLAFGTVLNVATPGVIDLQTGGTVHFGPGTVGNQTVYFIPPGGTAAIDDPGHFAATVSGFAQSDTIDLTALAFDAADSVDLLPGNVLRVSENGASEGGQTYDLQLDPADDFTGRFFHLASDGGSGTLVTEDTTPCYCRSTRILTDKGEVAVEGLAIGDRVVTISRATKPIKWIGHRAYDGRFVAGNRAMLPVRIAAGALADGVPARDLLVSPGHALFIDGVLVRAEQLVNGATITQETAVDRVEYFHIELDAHDILIADGAPAESYIDCDNRGKFHNAADFARLYPDDDRPRWQYCAPLLEWGSPEPDAIRARLMGRAGALGHRLDLDPDLHLVVDGTVIRPVSIDGRRYRFVIPAGAANASLASRSVVPAEIRADARDLRRLGVPVERLILYDCDQWIEAGHGHKGLADGFHDDEPTHRWTDGLARLPEAWLRSFPGEFTLEVHLIPADLPYRLPASARTRAAA
jgi:fibronectin-binding autotransporter adhesin